MGLIHFIILLLCWHATRFWWHLHLYSSPEHEVLRVSYCDRPLSVVCRRASCVVRQPFYLNIFFSETAHWILTKLHRNGPWVIPYQSCSNGFDWLQRKVIRSRNRIDFQNAIYKNLLVWNYKAQSFHIWYIASSRGLLPKLFKLSPWGQNFTLNYIRKTAHDFFSWTANGNLTKLNRNGPWVGALHKLFEWF